MTRSYSSTPNRHSRSTSYPNDQGADVPVETLLIIIRGLLCLGLIVLLPAAQIQEQDLVSPVTGQRFSVPMVMPGGGSGTQTADMGTDSDGCRHTTGRVEYDAHIVVDPSSYLATLASDWDSRSGRFKGTLPAGFGAWLTRQFAADLKRDAEAAIQLAQKTAKASGRPVPDRNAFVIPPQTIPPERRFRMALACLEQRGMGHALLGKVALTGAWALRSRAQVPVMHQSLHGGVDEVNTRIGALITNGERFNLPKWLSGYRDLLTRDGLSREGYVVATMARLGFELRDGDPHVCREVIQAGMQRIGTDASRELLRGLMRDRLHLVEEHQGFLAIAAQHFTMAVRDEEVVRARLPEILLAVGECHRRLGAQTRAADWYGALAALPETQPELRMLLRQQGRATGVPTDRSIAVQLGWMADDLLARVRTESPAGRLAPDASVLRMLTDERFGTAAYQSPTWTPSTGGSAAAVSAMLDTIGHATLDFAFRGGAWPQSLGELWERGLVDRQRYNRFHCPASGQPLVYRMPEAGMSSIAPSTILIATPTPVLTADGPRYAAFLASTRVVWSPQALLVGQAFLGP